MLKSFVDDPWTPQNTALYHPVHKGPGLPLKVQDKLLHEPVSRLCLTYGLGQHSKTATHQGSKSWLRLCEHPRLECALEPPSFHDDKDKPRRPFDRHKVPDPREWYSAGKLSAWKPFRRPYPKSTIVSGVSADTNAPQGPSIANSIRLHCEVPIRHAYVTQGLASRKVSNNGSGIVMKGGWLRVDNRRIQNLIQGAPRGK